MLREPLTLKSSLDASRNLSRTFDVSSRHTIRSYRDALVFFLRFVSNDSNRRLEDLGLEAFTAEHVTRFLAFLEVERHNGISTRNARLAALHTFARFLASESPEHLAELQRVLGLPFKRGGRNASIEYLEAAEVETLLRQIDRSTEVGRRDYALFALMLNTGARVQEVLDLKLSDVRTEPPYQVRLHGKGGNYDDLAIMFSSTSRTPDRRAAIGYAVRSWRGFCA
ncbi:tyrosine-type recombinase/integrase [Paraburkholderia sp. BL6665CI2N2]|uniref:tyrosine-type recombinase/integrase n=1 Tax=Paraburkholderia sp. BL6665CI2N2 TaxID=1938806 RepID=UPI001AB04FD5|nr:tyrosine-type recombinase/integrase [Paraburkholderia sp. BL6665CI2N2]